MTSTIRRHRIQSKTADREHQHQIDIDKIDDKPEMDLGPFFSTQPCQITDPTQVHILNTSGSDN